MLKTQNPDFKKTIQQKLKNNHFSHLIGFHLTKIKAGSIEGEMKILHHHQQQNGFVHGGVASTVCDIVAGFAAFSLVSNNEFVVTAEIKISYLNPGIGKKLIARGWVLKAGSKIHFCESEVWSIDGKKKTLIAKATASMAVVSRK